MNTLTPTTGLSRIKRRSLLAGSLGSVALAAVGCGGSGGDNTAGIGTGGTGSFTSGAIHGFGSIVVNHIRYNDTAAQIVADNGSPISNAGLRLGMVVDINGSQISTNASTGQRQANATHIKVRSEIEGPITAIDTAAGTITVLGQRVRATPNTVFDDDLRGGLQALRVGQLVEVHGFWVQNGQYTATRIDGESSLSRYKLRGVISQLNTAAHTFKVGNLLINYAQLAARVAPLSDGQHVRLELLPTPVGNTWRASSLQTASRAINLPGGNGLQAEIEGYITAFTSAQRFSVNGIEVDARNVRNLPTGLALGQRVEVEGTLAAGLLTAQSVELENDRDQDDDDFEIEGRIESVNTAARTLVVRGVTVNYANARFDGGTAAQLSVGRLIGVEGRLANGGTMLVATEIEFD